MELRSDATCQESKKEELRSHAKRDTWAAIPLLEGVKSVTCPWVNTDKYGPNGEITKGNRHGLSTKRGH